MDRLAVIARESQRLADVLSAIDPQTRCPTCPDWNASALLWHLTNVHFFWAGILERGILDAAELGAVEQAKPRRPDTMEDMLALREQATSALIDQLANRADSEPCWSWFPPDRTVGFTRRMQTYEATMHRVDAELAAAARPGAIGTDVAAGAVDHAVDVMWGWMPAGARYQPDSVVEFVATDTEQTWLVEVGSWSAPAHDSGELLEGRRAVRATGGNPTATAGAPVEDLALWSWTRGGSVAVSGDPAARAALDALVTQGMP